MGSKQRRKKRNLKILYKRRGHNIHKSRNEEQTLDNLDVDSHHELDESSKPSQEHHDDLTYKEICSQNILCAQNDANKADSDSIENKTNDEANEALPTLDIVCVESTTNEVDPLVLLNTGTSEYEIEVVPKEAPRRPSSLEGRRIINLINVYTKLQDISTHGPLNCNLKCVDIISEKQIGLHSTFTLLCKLCNTKFYVSSDECSEMDINNCAVLGTVAIGCGHSQLQEFCAALDLPLMGDKIYEKSHGKIADMWEGVSVNTMNDAAKEEKEIAILESRVDEKGVPIIDVIVDGCWSKRTYKKNYSALSGAAAIIGKRTGKILYLGVKNKYCCICAQAQYKKETPRKHKCYKNYCGPSTGMESNILVEGFKCSVEMHGLIYGRMISDGDSSTYSKIIEARPYSNVTVQKIECKNHIMRNMCNKLAQLKSDTKYPSRYRKNITDQKIISIRGTIKKAILKYTSDSEAEKRAHVELLYNDILLAHIHAFGEHSRCKTYFCNKTSEEGSSEHDFMTSSLWLRICQIISTVASYAPSLVHNVESNRVENFNSKIAKLVGGKRINFSLKGAYENRCKGAAISHNTRALLSKTYKQATGKSPKGKMKLLEEKRLKRCRFTKKRLRKKNRFLFCKGEDSNYGENCTREDISSEMMEKEKNTFLSNLKKNEEERKNIEKETILQSASSEWLELRRKLLTASNFGRVVKRRPDVSCRNLVKDLLYKDCISHVKSIKHGVDNEKIAIEQLSQQEGIKIQPCGLFIDEKLPYLGASPDGIFNDMTVEIKCPISAYQLNFEEAVNKKKVQFFKLNKNGNIIINKNHNWYYQIQGQLHITKKSKCLFGLWLGENMPVKIELIQKDDQFWNIEMEDKLTRFYLDCILPELIDPRHTRKMAIRDPSYIQKAIEKRTLKKASKIVNNDIAKRNKEPEIEIGQMNFKTTSTYFPKDDIEEEKGKKEIETRKQQTTKRKHNEMDTENKESKIMVNEEEKENIFNSATCFPNVNIQNFSEISDDDEIQIKRRKTSMRQLNFKEF